VKRFAAALILAASLLGAAAPAPRVDVARLLAETPAPRLADYHLFADAGGRRPNAGLTPYALNTPLFSDYAEKFRYVFVPPGTKVGYRPEGTLDFPVGAVLVKTFAYPADFRRPDEQVRFIETRLLIHRETGWVAFAYAWNREQTEAVLKRAGTRLDVAFIDAEGRARHVDYAVPNVNQCKECHSLGGELAPIGPKARNLNGDFAYPDGQENQLAHWRRVGLLEGAPAPAAIPAAAVWTDTRAPLEARARAYLDANCAHCHNPRGMASNSGLFLELEQTDPTAQGIEKRPVAAGRGGADFAYDIAPGDPESSILYYRMASTEPGVMMPELSRSLPHQEGLALIRDYIASLEPASPPP
jgi:uncharacterized repeat protein (TIGR03806 family)